MRHGGSFHMKKEKAGFVELTLDESRVMCARGA